MISKYLKNSIVKMVFDNYNFIGIIFIKFYIYYRLQVYICIYLRLNKFLKKSLYLVNQWIVKIFGQ